MNESSLTSNEWLMWHHGPKWQILVMRLLEVNDFLPRTATHTTFSMMSWSFKCSSITSTIMHISSPLKRSINADCVSHSFWIIAITTVVACSIDVPMVQLHSVVIGIATTKWREGQRSRSGKSEAPWTVCYTEKAETEVQGTYVHVCIWIWSIIMPIRIVINLYTLLVECTLSLWTAIGRISVLLTYQAK